MPVRIIALTTTNPEVDIKSTFSKFEKNENTKFIVFSSYDGDFGENVEIVKVPSDIASTDPKIKNFAMKTLFDRGEKGFIHLLEETIEILKSPEHFMNSLELMMKNLNLYSWFQTRKDECNYVLTKYNPKLKIEIDIPELKEKYDETIYFTPFSNPLWAIYDYSKATFETIKYDEDYTIPMYYIIDYLARKRNRGEGFMNCYPTIEAENGIFTTKDIPNKEDPTKNQLQMKVEELTFKKKRVDFKPDNDIEKVMAWTFNTLKETLS